MFKNFIISLLALGLLAGCSDAQIIHGEIRSCELEVVEEARETSLGPVDVYSVSVSVDHENGDYKDARGLLLNENGYEYSSGCVVVVSRDGVEYQAHGCQNDDPDEGADCSLQYTEISSGDLSGHLRCKLQASDGSVDTLDWEFSFSGCVQE